MDTPNETPGLSKAKLEMQSQGLFDNDKDAINDQSNHQQDGCHSPTNYQPSGPMSTDTITPNADSEQPHNEVEDALNDDDGSLSPKHDVPVEDMSENIAFPMDEENDEDGVILEDDGTTSDDSTQQEVGSRPNAAAETVRANPARKLSIKKANQLKAVAIQEPPLKPSGLYFDNITEARQVVYGLDWPARDDKTLSKTQEEREGIILELLNAIQDINDVKDRRTGAALQKRWLGEIADEGTKNEDANPDETQQTPKIGSDAVYKPWQKERICWDILATAERIYLEGTRFVSIIDPVKLQDYLLRMYKARIDKLMGGGLMEWYVLCAQKLLDNSATNRSMNDAHGEWIVVGRKESQSRQPIVGQDAVAVPTSGHSRKRMGDNPEGAASSPKSRAKRSRKA
ncbi:hypothetical protein G6011_04329 [Alternaria panax]|uniref:Uncharacterized protein n=1 Tax=Alternaria panax TaxID=48097 RepID=A0AAD4IGW8_9PLEO|nr:hypothetical protein G6011_04329 [Alternaria panax]